MASICALDTFTFTLHKRPSRKVYKRLKIKTEASASTALASILEDIKSDASSTHKVVDGLRNAFIFQKHSPVFGPSTKFLRKNHFIIGSQRVMLFHTRHTETVEKTQSIKNLLNKKPDKDVALEAALQRYKHDPNKQQLLIDAFTHGIEKSDKRFYHYQFYRDLFAPLLKYFVLAPLFIFAIYKGRQFFDASVEITIEDDDMCKDCKQPTANGDKKSSAASTSKGSGGLLSKLLDDFPAAHHKAEVSNVTFNDVVGCDEVKAEMQNLVSFLRNPESFADIGAVLPRGTLLIGPPGVGKTLLARAVAGEAGCPFFYASASEFDHLYVGTGAANVKKLFQDAKKNAPCVIFIDEFDNLGRKRSDSARHPYANQTVNQLLSEMDGFEKCDNVIVLAATNRSDALDKAVLRPGRFDSKVFMHYPDGEGRRQLFQLFLKNVQHKNINLDEMSNLTRQCTGADIRNIVNQAAILAVLGGETHVTMRHLHESLMKNDLGLGRKKLSLFIDRKISAYHEAGRAICLRYNPHSDGQVSVVSIQPRGDSSGYVVSRPKEEKVHTTKEQLLSRIDSYLAGRVAEELMFGIDKVTELGHDSLAKASTIARSMVEELGMSSNIGLQVSNESLSPETRSAIDKEVSAILESSHQRAKKILEDHKTELIRIAEALLAHETLSGRDFELLLQGKPMVDIFASKSKEEDSRNISNFFGYFSPSKLKPVEHPPKKDPSSNP